MKKLILPLLAVLALSGCGDNPQIKTLQLNYQGNKAMKANNFQQAMDRYVEALGLNPFLAELHLNLGLAFEMLQQAEKAQQSYQEAERLAQAKGDQKMVFMARFNQAQLLGKAKKVDEAIALYQKCLDIIPSSKEVKTNIELLTQAQQGKGGSSDQQNKDQQNQNQNQQQQQQNGKDGKDQKDQDKKQDQNKDGQDKKDQDKQYSNSAKYKPRPFNGKELTEGDVKKILGEIKQQESKIRADFNRKEVKEQPRDKDW